MLKETIIKIMNLLRMTLKENARAKEYWQYDYQVKLTARMMLKEDFLAIMHRLRI